VSVRKRLQKELGERSGRMLLDYVEYDSRSYHGNREAKMPRGTRE
jgi:hypothetical protein